MARYCKECENEIPAGYDICPTCGALVDGTGNYYDEVDDEEGIGNKRFGFNLRKLKQQRERRSAYQDEDVTDEKARGGRYAITVCGRRWRHCWCRPVADNAAAAVYPFGKHNPDYQVGGR